VTSMKFCPKCGGLMTPMKQGGKVVLKCMRCGYTEEINPRDAASYRLSEQIPANERTITTLRVSKAKWKPPKSLEEWEQEREEYREVLHELLQEELEGGEE